LEYEVRDDGHADQHEADQPFHAWIRILRRIDRGWFLDDTRPEFAQARDLDCLSALAK